VFVADLIIQPTRKWIRLQYWTVFLLCAIATGVYVNRFIDRVSPWFLVIPALLLFFPVRAHLRQYFTKMTLTADKLRYESGAFSKTVRTLQLAKVQDVTVKQSVLQRLAGTGDLSIETAGEEGLLTVADIDDAQAVADAISDASQGLAQKPKGARS
jgi:uncharacterized membrane protein YdbT with pleckstrin-like domain